MPDLICKAKPVQQDDGTVGYVPDIQFSEFPGAWQVGPDPDDQKLPAYFEASSD